MNGLCGVRLCRSVLRRGSFLCSSLVRYTGGSSWKSAAQSKSVHLLKVGDFVQGCMFVGEDLLWYGTHFRFLLRFGIRCLVVVVGGLNGFFDFALLIYFFIGANALVFR